MSEHSHASDRSVGRPAVRLPAHGDPRIRNSLLAARQPGVLYSILFSLTALYPIGQFGNTVTVGAVIGFPMALMFSFSREAALPKSLGRIQAVALGAIVSSPVIIAIAFLGDESRGFDTAELGKHLGSLVSAVVISTCVVHASKAIGVIKVCVLVSVGAIAYALTSFDTTDFGELWKYRLAWPVCVLGLAVVYRCPRPVQISLLGGFAVIAAISNSRNNLVALVIAMVMVSLSARPTGLTDRGSRIGAFTKIVCLALFAVVIANILPELASQGILGQAIQQKQASQLGEAGVFGGRIEYGATFALMQNTTGLGLGPGVTPSANDVATGWAGLSAIGVDPLAGYNAFYASTSVLAGSFELHSIAADFWLRFGPLGLAIAALALGVCTQAIVRVFTDTKVIAIALTAFMAVQSMWDLLFSPLKPNGWWVFVTVGICIYQILTVRAADERASAIPPDLGRIYAVRAPTWDFVTLKKSLRQ